MTAKPSRRERATMLSIVLQGDEPPNEFRIFRAGQNDTSKGTFLFDEVAAKLVMADYATQGNELMIDYDHASLAGLSIDPAQSGKAAGWFGLEVRAGDLWAVNVRWTPPAAEALRRKEWRYMSPAFCTDEELRVTSVMNVALTNIPATRNLEPLMAASLITRLGEGMDPKLIAEALDALVDGDAEKCAELLKGLIASAAGAAAAPAEDPAPPVEAAEGDDPEEEDKPEEMAAALSLVARLSGKASLVDAISQIKIWHASHLELETERQRLAQERATLEAAERRRLCADLVTKAGKAPAEVWASDKADAPKKYFASMPIEDFRELVADAVKAHGKTARAENAGAPMTTPPGGGRDVVTKAGATVRLSQRELDMCAEFKIDPVEYAATKPKKVA
jgi:hypothetical protein